MAKARSLEAKLEALHALRTAPATPALAAELRAALQDRSNFVVAAAAEVAGESGLTELAPDLAEAFARFMVDPLAADKRCAAKGALAEALADLGVPCAAVFLPGVRYAQHEPSWGGESGARSVDVAGPVRSACGLGLLRMGHEEAMPALVDLLADPLAEVRAAAARYLGAGNPSEALPALRLRVRIGDPEAEVLGECFAAMLALDADRGVPFVAGYLRGKPEVGVVAALALGNARRPDALAALLDYWRAAQPRDSRDEVFLAIALTRLPAAAAFLLAALAVPADAPAALSALAVLRHDAKLRAEVAAAVERAGSKPLAKLFEEKFNARG